jgi:signal transduction histidine kinase
MDETERNPEMDPLEQARRDLFDAERSLREGPESEPEQDPVLRRLLDVVERINADLNTERVLDVASREVLEIFQAERVFIVETVSESELRFRVAVDFEGREIVTPDSEVSHAVLRKVADTREPVLVADATEDPRFGQVSSVQHLDLHSVMAAPLIARDHVLGVVYADNRVARGVFNSRTLDLLRIFASHVGVALRNAQLFRELEEARAELAQSERLKTVGQMATFIVHEVKKSLSSIKILTEALEERWEEESLRNKVLEVVPREVSRLNESVHQLLDYARPTSLNRCAVQMQELVDSSLRTLEAEFREKDIEVVREFEDELPAVLGDGERLREVFINLLRNAIEALEGQDRPCIRVSVLRAGQNRVAITVEDNGPGITEDLIDTIFEPFNTSKDSGTGLGLAFCEKLIREHGGTITAENRAGGGARFRVRLPVQGS